MHSVRRIVYYCDWGECKQHRFTLPGMENHESRCTWNPSRLCRMPFCRKIDGPCPWCQLAIVRAGNFTDETWDYNRDIKAEARSWRQRYFVSSEVL